MIQTWKPERYERIGGFVSDLGMPVVELLAPRPEEHILDLGCGDGVLTEKLVAMGCRVIGVDTSKELIEAAKARGLDVQVMDGQSLMFENEFDAVFSNAALHWMKRTDDVISGVWRALKRGGRFVAEFGGTGNIEKILAALYKALWCRGIDGDFLNPWYFPTPDNYRKKLEAHGFKVNYMALIPRPTVLPGDISDWLETFTESFTSILAKEERLPFIYEVRGILRETLCDPKGNWIADYVRLRFFALKPKDETLK